METSHSYPCNRRSAKSTQEERFRNYVIFPKDMPENDLYWKDQDHRKSERKPLTETTEEMTARIRPVWDTILDLSKGSDCEFPRLYLS